MKAGFSRCKTLSWFQEAVAVDWLIAGANMSEQSDSKIWQDTNAVPPELLAELGLPERELTG